MLPEDPDAPLRIAMLAPLTGPDATLGQSMVRAATMAVFDHADPRLELRPYDTAGTPDGASAAAAAATADGARLIIGPLFAASARAVGPILPASGVNALAFTNDNTAGSENVFVLGMSPNQQVDRIVAYARGQGLERFAALVPSDAYGNRMALEFERAVAAGGGLVVRTVVYEPGQNAIADAVKQLGNYDERRQALRQRIAEVKPKADAGDPTAKRELRALEAQDTLGDVDFEALFVPAVGGELRQVAAVLPFYDVDPRVVRLLGVADWREDGLGREPALNGGWFAGLSDGIARQVAVRFRQVWNERLHPLALLAYDAAAISAILGRTQGAEGFDTDALTSPNGFAGATGIFRLLPGGQSQRGLAVYEVTPTGFRVIDAAPATFETLTQ